MVLSLLLPKHLVDALSSVTIQIIIKYNYMAVVQFLGSQEEC